MVHGVVVQHPESTQPPETSTAPLGSALDAVGPVGESPPAPQADSVTPGTIDWLTPGGENTALFSDGRPTGESPSSDPSSDTVYVDTQGTYFTLDADGLPQVVDAAEVGDRQAVDINSTGADLVNDAFKSSTTGAVAAAEPVPDGPDSGLSLTSALSTIQNTQIETQTFDQAAAGQSAETFVASESPATSGGWADSSAAGVGAGDSSSAGASPTGSGGVSVDGGTPPADTSAPPTDTSTPPSDASAPPTDGAAPPADSSAASTDTSAPPTDTSSPPADASPPPEMSSPPPESSAPSESTD